MLNSLVGQRRTTTSTGTTTSISIAIETRRAAIITNREIGNGRKAKEGSKLSNQIAAGKDRKGSIGEFGLGQKGEGWS